MKKQVYLVASDAGNIGKTLVASGVLEAIRLYTRCDAYVCDSNFQGLYERYGQKKNGKRIPLSEQSPTDGVAFLNFFLKEERAKLGDALGSKSDYVLFDLAANSSDHLATAIESPEELAMFFDFADAEGTIISPIKDAKSIKSYENMQSIFPTFNFVPVINAGFIKCSETVTDAKRMIEEYKDMFKGVPHMVIEQTLSPTILELMKNHTMRELYVPRSERKDADGNLNQSDDDFLLKNKRDQFIMDRFLTDFHNDVKRLFIK
jgi:hypothetical protein